MYVIIFRTFKTLNFIAVKINWSIVFQSSSRVLKMPQNATSAIKCLFHVFVSCSYTCILKQTEAIPSLSTFCTLGFSVDSSLEYNQLRSTS